MLAATAYQIPFGLIAGPALVIALLLIVIATFRFRFPGAVHRSFHWVSDYLVGPRTWNRLWIRDRALGVDPQATAGTLWRSSPRGVLYALRWLVPGRNCRSCLVGSSEFDQVGGLPHPWGEGHANRSNLRLFKVH